MHSPTRRPGCLWRSSVGASRGWPLLCPLVRPGLAGDTRGLWEREGLGGARCGALQPGCVAGDLQRPPWSPAPRGRLLPRWLLGPAQHTKPRGRVNGVVAGHEPFVQDECSWQEGAGCGKPPGAASRPNSPPGWMRGKGSRLRALQSGPPRVADGDVGPPPHSEARGGADRGCPHCPMIVGLPREARSPAGRWSLTRCPWPRPRTISVLGGEGKRLE